jgi:hypothetical protein
VAEWFNQFKARAAAVARPRKPIITKAGPTPEGTPAGDKAVTCQLHYNPGSDKVQVTIRPVSTARHPPKAAITKVRNQFGLLQLLSLIERVNMHQCHTVCQPTSLTQITQSVPKLTPCAAVLYACALQVDKLKSGLSAVVSCARKVASRPKLPNLRKVSRQPQQAHSSEVVQGGEDGEASGKPGPKARSCQWVRRLLKGSVAAAAREAVRA